MIKRTVSFVAVSTGLVVLARINFPRKELGELLLRFGVGPGVRTSKELMIPILGSVCTFTANRISVNR